MSGPAPFSDPPPSRPAFGLAWMGTVLWLAVCALVFFGFAGGEADLDPLRVMMVPVAVLTPVALIWMATWLVWRLEVMSRSLEHLANADRQLGADVIRKIDALRPALSPSGAAPAMPFASGRASAGRPAMAASASAAPPEQASMALDPPAQETPRPELGIADLIAALQFPVDADDTAGFRALRRALSDHKGRQIVTAAQDVLTLLSQDGLYMDDFTPERARPETWRRFATGERGASVGAVGGLRDPETLALVTHRLRQDTIFRDAAHHFIRMFDQMMARVEPRLTDTELAAMADTRSARAFMLIGRAIGTFD